jgi:hypothetical protein
LTDDASHAYLAADNRKLHFGAGNDAVISYDGTDMLIDPAEVGSGVLDIAGDLRLSGATGIINRPLDGDTFIFQTNSEDIFTLTKSGTGGSGRTSVKLAAGANATSDVRLDTTNATLLLSGGSDGNTAAGGNVVLKGHSTASEGGNIILDTCSNAAAASAGESEVHIRLRNTNSRVKITDASSNDLWSFKLDGTIGHGTNDIFEEALPVSFALADNQAAAADVFTLTAATYDSVIVDYSISRGAGIREAGQLFIATDGTTADLGGSSAGIGSTGTTFSVDISGADVRLRYTTTSTGTAGVMNYKVKRWLST